MDAILASRRAAHAGGGFVGGAKKSAPRRAENEGQKASCLPNPPRRSREEAEDRSTALLAAARERITPFTARVQRRLASHAQRSAASVASRGSAPSGRAARDFGSAEISGLEVRRPPSTFADVEATAATRFREKTTLALRRETTARSTRASEPPSPAKPKPEGATPKRPRKRIIAPSPETDPTYASVPSAIAARCVVFDTVRKCWKRADAARCPHDRAETHARDCGAHFLHVIAPLASHGDAAPRWSHRAYRGTVENLLEDCGKVIRHLERRVETLQAEVRETEAEARAAMETNATEANATDSDSSDSSERSERSVAPPPRYDPPPRKQHPPPPAVAAPVLPPPATPTLESYPPPPEGVAPIVDPPAHVPIAEDDWKRLEWPGVRIVAEYPNAPRAPPRPAPTPPPPFVPPVCVPLPSPPVAPDGWGDGVRPSEDDDRAAVWDACMAATTERYRVESEAIAAENEAALAEAESAHDATMRMVREVDAAALAAWRADVEAIREGHAAAIAAAAEKNLRRVALTLTLFARETARRERLFGERRDAEATRRRDAAASAAARADETAAALGGGPHTSYFVAKAHKARRDKHDAACERVRRRNALMQACAKDARDREVAKILRESAAQEAAARAAWRERCDVVDAANAEIEMGALAAHAARVDARRAETRVAAASATERGAERARVSAVTARASRRARIAASATAAELARARLFRVAVLRFRDDRADAVAAAVEEIMEAPTARDGERSQIPTSALIPGKYAAPTSRSIARVRGEDDEDDGEGSGSRSPRMSRTAPGARPRVAAAQILAALREAGYPGSNVGMVLPAGAVTRGATGGGAEATAKHLAEITAGMRRCACCAMVKGK